jgi:hypothetical protein
MEHVKFKNILMLINLIHVNENSDKIPQLNFEI